MTQWHPTSDQLVEYAAGSTTGALSIAVATHLHFCHECRTRVSELESTAAVLFEKQESVALAADSFAKLMQRIKTEPMVKSQSMASRTPSRFPPVVDKLIRGRLESLDWNAPMKNLRTTRLMVDESGLILGLHHMRAGGRVPHHQHRGNEISVVMEGGFSDEIGTYGPGDFVHLSLEHSHSPQAHADGDCWMLSLVEAPVKLTGPIGWVVNPFLKA
jgi:putative transcriptional regulator